MSEQPGTPPRVRAAVRDTPLIRDSRETDLEAIRAIYAHHVAHGTGSFELEPPSCEEMARRRSDVLANGFAHRVAELEGEVVGFAYFNFFRLRPAYRFSVENSVYVRAGQQRAGIGRALLTDLVEQAQTRGLRQMIAVIGDSANTGSIGLHAACGFRFAGVLRASGWKFDRWLDTVLMQRELGAADRHAPDLT
jgi:phosphinothricin acetyltransferase